MKLITLALQNLTLKLRFNYLGYEIVPKEITYLDENGKPKKITVLVGRKERD